MQAEPAVLPPLRVSVDADRAAAYGRETGFCGDAVPLAYPAVWLSASEVRDAIAKVCEEAEAVPVHESQAFSYAAPLRYGEDYELAVALRREETPPRLILDATVTTLSGEAVARIETMLRIVPRAGLAGAASGLSGAAS